jgi:hypothetical protein
MTPPEKNRCTRREKSCTPRRTRCVARRAAAGHARSGKHFVVLPSARAAKLSAARDALRGGDDSDAAVVVVNAARRRLARISYLFLSLSLSESRR